MRSPLCCEIGAPQVPVGTLTAEVKLSQIVGFRLVANSEALCGGAKEMTGKPRKVSSGALQHNLTPSRDVFKCLACSGQQGDDRE